MKIKLINVVNIYNLLIEFSNEKVPTNVAYWIIKNMSIIRDVNFMYIKQRNEIWSKYLYSNDDGTIATKNDMGVYEYNCKDGEKNNFINDMNELNNFEVELDFFHINLKDLIDSNSNMVIEPRIIIGLLDLISVDS